MWVWKVESPLHGGVKGAPSKFSIGNAWNLVFFIF